MSLNPGQLLAERQHSLDCIMDGIVISDISGKVRCRVNIGICLCHFGQGTHLLNDCFGDGSCVLTSGSLTERRRPCIVSDARRSFRSVQDQLKTQ